MAKATSGREHEKVLFIVMRMSCKPRTAWIIRWDVGDEVGSGLGFGHFFITWDVWRAKRVSDGKTGL